MMEIAKIDQKTIRLYFQEGQDRVCLHLRIPATSEIEDIEGAYVGAADNSILTAVRPLISINAPTYSQVLLLIYKKLRPFSKDLDETWHRVKSLKFWGYKPPLGDMDDLTFWYYLDSGHF